MKGIQEEYEKCKAEKEQLELLLITDYKRRTVNITDLVDELTIDQFNLLVEGDIISKEENVINSEFQYSHEILETCISENVYPGGAKKIRIDFKRITFYEGDNETPRGRYPSRTIRMYCMIFPDGKTEINCEHDVPYERFRLVDFTK